MPLRLLADAAANSTVPGSLTAGATSIVAQSTANFPSPASGQQFSATILDSGNPSYNAAAPLATPFEYVYCTNNNTGTNTLTVQRGQAGTTGHSFFAGATIAATLLAEDIVASAPWHFDEQSPTGSSFTIPASGSIPASYLGINWRTIRIAWAARTTSGNNSDLLEMQFNGDTGSNYIYDVIGGQANAVNTANSFVGATSAVTTFLRCGVCAGGAVGAGLFAGGWIEIPFYAITTFRRFFTAMTWRHDSVFSIDHTTGEWNNTANAITSITLFPAAGNFASGSIFSTSLIP